MIIFERSYSVNVFNTDLTGRLSTGALFSFFEDIAGRHALELGWGRDDLMSKGVFWALSRMVVKVEHLPNTWEDIVLRTWPRGVETIFALRDLEMYDTSGKRLAAASSSWVIVDYSTRKAQRPDKALSDLNNRFPAERALGTNARRVPPLPAGDHEMTRLKVKLDDIDVNRHVNNARYVHWAVDCHNPEFICTHTPDTVEVNYIAEGHQNEMINIFTAPADDARTSFIHSVTRESDGAELCRLRMSWKENRL
jgi:acyl-ACP thioesterase